MRSQGGLSIVWHMVSPSLADSRTSFPLRGHSAATPTAAAARSRAVRPPAWGTGLLAFAVAAGLWLAAVAPVLAWGELGHRLVARLAEAHLTPEARRFVAATLDGESLADVAIWADRIKPDRPETAPWHYQSFDPQREWDDDPAPTGAAGALLTATAHCRDLLAGDAGTPTERREALMFLVHLVGDLHQPLHCAPAGDQGGNAVKVWLFGEESNLHRVWDGGLIFRTGLAEDVYLASLETTPEPGVAPGDPGTRDWDAVFAGWAAESNRAAVWHAYRLPSDHRLEERYLQANIRVVNRQLKRAGLRLADILNDLADRQPPTMAIVPPSTPPAAPAALATGL
ncbi:MAG: S1/P1 nuclease [Candidatus Riflebacteria bacterium]|nr:S1/P1 nuclease [Candidatus Riflebacteria bacterium]